MPTDAGWLHSETHAKTHFEYGPRWGDVYLDPVNKLLFFVLYDH